MYGNGQQCFTIDNVPTTHQKARLSSSLREAAFEASRRRCLVDGISASHS